MYNNNRQIEKCHYFDVPVYDLLQCYKMCCHGNQDMHAQSMRTLNHNTRRATILLSHALMPHQLYTDENLCLEQKLSINFMDILMLCQQLLLLLN